MTSKPLSHLKRLKTSTLFLILAVIIGGAIRMGFALTESFPLNDGGLFFTMTEELIAGGFRMPAFTAYNHLQIPFAYPPLGFYLAGGLQVLFGWDLLVIFRILPAVFTVMAIPAFYFLARALVSDELTLGISVLVFAFLPPTMEWLIMGGGITRSPAFVFSLLALLSAYRLYTREKTLDIVLTAVFSALTILLHPEAAVHTAAGILVFFLFKDRGIKNALRSLLVLALILVLTAPWWVTVIRKHGLGPFLAAGGTGLHSFQNLMDLLLFSFTGEILLTIIAVLAIIGIFIFISSRSMMIPVWLLLSFFAGPRSADLYLAPIIALLAANTFQVLVNSLDSGQINEQPASEERTYFFKPTSRLLLATLCVQLIFNLLLTGYLVTNLYTLDQADISAMAWVKEHAPTHSKFLVLSGLTPLRNAPSEWFPTLTDRIAITTLQGHEWLVDSDFDIMFDKFADVQSCVYEDLACLLDWQDTTRLNFDFVYLRKSVPNALSKAIPTIALQNALENSERFVRMYETETVLVYQRFSIED